jgi:drug/metabolite transporter (DMT)-like permease
MAVKEYMLDKQKGVLALLAAAVLSGSFGVFSHYINFNIPLFYQVTFRGIVQLIILTALYLFFDTKKPIAKKDIKWFFFRSACGFINSFGLYVAFTKITIGTTYFLSFAASTVCGYVLGSTLFKEQVTRRSLIALGLSLVGLGLVYSVSFQLSTVWYSLAAIVAGIAAPGWTVFSKYISKTYSNIQMNLVDTVFAVILAIACCLLLREHIVAIKLDPIWIASFAMALIFLLAGLLVVYGFRRVDAQVGTLLLLVEAVSGIGLGYLFYKQTIPPRDVIGGLMITSAIYIRTRTSTSRRLFTT